MLNVYKKKEIILGRRQLITENIMPFLGELDKIVPELGMGDLGQLHHPLIDASSLKFGNTILGDDEIHVPPCGSHAGAFAQMGDDTGHLTVLGGGRKGHNGKAPLGHGAASQIIHLVADTAVKQIADGVGTDLSRQIDFQG